MSEADQEKVEGLMMKHVAEEPELAEWNNSSRIPIDDLGHRLEKLKANNSTTRKRLEKIQGRTSNELEALDKWRYFYQNMAAAIKSNKTSWKEVYPLMKGIAENAFKRKRQIIKMLKDLEKEVSSV